MRKPEYFKLQHKYHLIPRTERIKWLQKKITAAAKERITSIEEYREYGDKRKSFSLGGLILRDNQICFTCCDIATVRHHVTPLILGGRNKNNNIVPLCNKCHVTVHSVGPRNPLLVAIQDTDPGVLRIRNLLHEMYSK